MAATLVRAATASAGAVNDAASITGFPSPGQLAVQVTGTWSATITFEVTVDGTNWVSYELNPTADMQGTSGSLSATTAANGVWVGPSFGLAGFRARVSAYTSGTAVITVRYSAF